jgi:hypothetical protein
LSGGAKDIAQNGFDPAAAGLTRWRCRGVVVVFVLLWAAAAREGLRFVRLFLLRWQGAISALRTTLAAELTQQIPEDIRSLSLALSLRLSAATNERVENASGVEHRRDPPKGGSPRWHTRPVGVGPQLRHVSQGCAALRAVKIRIYSAAAGRRGWVP